MSGGGADQVDETSYQKALGEVAANEWNRYQDVFVPMENDYIAYANSMGDQAYYDKASDDTSLAFNKNYGEVQDQTNKALAASGVDPTSGKTTAANADLVESQLGNENQTTSQAHQDQTQAYTGSLSNVVAMGRGQQTEAINGLQDIAQASGAKARSDAINEANEVSIPGVALGVGSAVVAGNKDWFSGGDAKSLSDYNNVSPGAQNDRNNHNQLGAVGV